MKETFMQNSKKALNILLVILIVYTILGLVSCTRDSEFVQDATQLENLQTQYQEEEIISQESNYIYEHMMFDVMVRSGSIFKINVDLAEFDFYEELSLIDRHCFIDEFSAELYINGDRVFGDNYGKSSTVFYIQDEYINKLMGELRIDVYGLDDNLVEQVYYKNVFLYDATNKTTLEDVSNDFLNAETLFILNGDKLKNIDILEQLKNIKYLHYEFLCNSDNFSLIGTLATLEGLEITSTTNCENLDFLENLVLLKELVVRVPEGMPIKNIDALYNLPNLKKLIISGISLTEPARMNTLNQLQYLDMSNFSIISCRDFFDAIPNLTELKIKNAEKIGELSFLEDLAQLKSLEITNASISFDENFGFGENVENLTLRECSLENVSYENIKHIKNLTLYYCDNFDKIDFSKLINVESLAFVGNYVADLKFIDNLQNLKYLKTSGESDTENFVSIGLCENLEILDIAFNSFGSECNYENFDFLSGLTNLKAISISGLNITDFSGLEELINLEYLSIWYSDMPDLANMDKLKKIVGYYASLDKTSNISDCVSLEYLDLHGCRISDLLFICTNKNLKKISFDDTNFTTKLPDLSSLAQLKELSFDECSGIDFIEIGIPNALEVLSATYSSAINWEAVGNIKLIKKIDFSESDIFDISFLKDMTNLRYLAIFETNVEDIEVFKDMTNVFIIYD